MYNSFYVSEELVHMTLSIFSPFPPFTLGYLDVTPTLVKISDVTAGRQDCLLTLSMREPKQVF